MKHIKYYNHINENFDFVMGGLRRYIDDEFHLMNSMNFLINNRDQNWLDKIGKYFLDKIEGIDIKNTPLESYDLLLNRKRKKGEDFHSEGIFFITSFLNEDALKLMFGNPIFHSEFGEGFDDDRNYDYCSYFLEIDRHIIHIGYDHRGTAIELEGSLDAPEVFEIIKSIIDLYIEKVLK